jgi:hypothetical protein
MLVGHEAAVQGSRHTPSMSGETTLYEQALVENVSVPIKVQSTPNSVKPQRRGDMDAENTGRVTMSTCPLLDKQRRRRISTNQGMIVSPVYPLTPTDIPMLGAVEGDMPGHGSLRA